MFPFKLIDLTHTLEPDIPTWNGTCGFKHDIKLDYDSCTTPTKFRVQQIKMHAGVATHMDAPAHCIEGGKTVEDIHLKDLIAPCVRIDVSHLCDAYYTVTLDDLKRFEAEFGQIPEEAFVIIYTGWEKRWKVKNLYLNNYNFPAISEEVALYLLERKVKGIGTDTISPDRPQDGIFPVHKAFLKADKYIIENVANALSLPEISSFSLCLPLKTKGGTEAPVRLVGLVS